MNEWIGVFIFLFDGFFGCFGGTRKYFEWWVDVRIYEDDFVIFGVNFGFHGLFMFVWVRIRG